MTLSCLLVLKEALCAVHLIQDPPTPTRHPPVRGRYLLFWPLKGELHCMWDLLFWIQTHCENKNSDRKCSLIIGHSTNLNLWLNHFTHIELVDLMWITILGQWLSSVRSSKTDILTQKALHWIVCWNTGNYFTKTHHTLRNTLKNETSAEAKPGRLYINTVGAFLFLSYYTCYNPLHNLTRSSPAFKRVIFPTCRFVGSMRSPGRIKNTAD